MSIKLKLTLVDIVGIDMREKSTTKGPWKWKWVTSDDPSGDRDGDVLYGRDDRGKVELVTPYREMSGHDSQFIAHAREDIPTLVSDWRTMYVEINRLYRLLEEKDEPKNG